MQGMSSTLARPGQAQNADSNDLFVTDDVMEPVVAEFKGVRLRVHARSLRGSMTLVEVARRAGLNRDELSRLEKGETTQVRFSTLAKLIAVYGCSLEDLVEVERPQTETPLYAAALAALADGTLPMAGRQRRAVRRSLSLDAVTEGEEEAFAPSALLPSRRRRSPVGTVHQ